MEITEIIAITYGSIIVIGLIVHLYFVVFDSLVNQRRIQKSK